METRDDKKNLEKIIEERFLEFFRNELLATLQRDLSNVTPSETAKQQGMLHKDIWYPRFDYPPHLIFPGFAKFYEPDFAITQADRTAAGLLFEAGQMDLENTAMYTKLGRAFGLLVKEEFIRYGNKQTDKFQTDLTCMIGKFMIANVEARQVGGSGHKLKQNIAYYVKYLLKENKFNLLLPTSFPAVLLTVDGPTIFAHAIITSPKNINISELGVIQMLGGSSVTFNCQVLFCAALRAVFTELREYYRKLIQKLNKEPYGLLSSLTPFVQNFLFENIECEIIYKSKISEKLVFQAIIFGDHEELHEKVVIVKFARTYSAEAHNYFYRKGAAPKLYGCSKVGNSKQGSFILVIMENISGTLLTADLDTIDADFKYLSDVVKQAGVDGYVHGDLRLPNLLHVDKGTPKIIDFDWAGKVGTARYPLSMRTDIAMWPKAAEPLALITPEQDLERLDMTFKEIKSPAKVSPPSSVTSVGGINFVIPTRQQVNNSARNQNPKKRPIEQLQIKPWSSN